MSVSTCPHAARPGIKQTNRPGPARMLGTDEHPISGLPSAARAAAVRFWKHGGMAGGCRADEHPILRTGPGPDQTRNGTRLCGWARADRQQAWPLHPADHAGWPGFAPGRRSDGPGPCDGRIGSRTARPNGKPAAQATRCAGEDAAAAREQPRLATSPPAEREHKSEANKRGTHGRKPIEGRPARRLPLLALPTCSRGRQPAPSPSNPPGSIENSGVCWLVTSADSLLLQA